MVGSDPSVEFSTLFFLLRVPLDINDTNTTMSQGSLLSNVESYVRQEFHQFLLLSILSLQNSLNVG